MYLSSLQEPPGETSFVTEGSEASFVTAASHAAPAGSVVSELDYASLDDEAEEDFHYETVHGQVSLHDWLCICCLVCRSSISVRARDIAAGRCAHEGFTQTV